MEGDHLIINIQDENNALNAMNSACYISQTHKHKCLKPKVIR